MPTFLAFLSLSDKKSLALLRHTALLPWEGGGGGVHVSYIPLHLPLTTRILCLLTQYIILCLDLLHSPVDVMSPVHLLPAHFSALQTLLGDGPVEMAAAGTLQVRSGGVMHIH